MVISLVSLELTSGLDSFTAFAIVKVMRELARKGKTVITIVQQPSTDIFTHFDRIYLLANGTQAYQGTTEKIYDYFKMIGHEIPAYTNPADQLIKVMHAKEKPEPSDIKEQEELFLNYDKHLRPDIEVEIQEAEKNVQPLSKEKLSQFRATSFKTQFQHLMKRTMTNLVRNVTLSRVRIGQTVAMALIMDILFWNKEGYEQKEVSEKNGALFFVCTSQLMLSIQSVILTCNSTCSL